MKTLTLGYSPCPNDTFIFYALTHGKIDAPGITVAESLEDVETLNRRAMKAELDLTKVSFHALAYLRKDYCLLRSGGALGRGCGPLVVTKKHDSMSKLRGRKIAVPGRYTTAHLLLMLYDTGYENVAMMPFDRIMPAVAAGEVDAGVIIHEGRFTYQGYGLRKLLDLGEWWEAETTLPIPLGGILAKRSLGAEVISAAEAAVRESVKYAFSHRDEARSYIKAHAQEIEDSVIEGHINLYVNDFSIDLGDEGVRAVEELFSLSMARGIIPGSYIPLFL
ncbi:MAG: 1,4-dihydroxy-6-naphthoate synthase [Nitrospirota bacterium]